MNKEQQCWTSKKDVILLRTEVTILSTDGVCRSNSLAPFQMSQYTNREVQRDEYGSIQLSPDHTHFWWWKRKPCRTFAYRTDPHPLVETRHYIMYIIYVSIAKIWEVSKNLRADPLLFSVLFRWGTKQSERVPKR